jgi:hypothetical protein
MLQLADIVWLDFNCNLATRAAFEPVLRQKMTLARNEENARTRMFFVDKDRAAYNF